MVLGNVFSFGSTLGALFIVIALWDLFWKGWALWVSARENRLTWFIVLLIINSAGILPLLYLLFFQRTPWYKGGTAKNKHSKRKR